MRVIVLLALAGLLLLPSCVSEQEALTAEAPPLVLELPSVSRASAEPMQPWSLELQADVVALGTVGPHFRHAGQRLLRVDLTDILKGEAELGLILPPDKAPWLGCIPPKHVDRPSDRLSPGTEILVYLIRSGEGELSIFQIGQAPESVQHLRDFFALEARLQGPEIDWQVFFAEQPEPGVSAPAYFALRWKAWPEAATPALVTALERATSELANDRVAEQGLHRIALLVELANHSNDPALFPVLLELAEWQASASGHPHDGFLPAGRILAQLDSEGAVRWNVVLSSLLRRAQIERSNPHYQRTAHCLAALPQDTGIPTLIAALDDHRSESVAALIRRRPTWTDERLRARLHRRARQILNDPALEGDEHLIFRRHLERLLEES